MTIAVDLGRKATKQTNKISMAAKMAANDVAVDLGRKATKQTNTISMAAKMAANEIST